MRSEAVKRKVVKISKNNLDDSLKSDPKVVDLIIEECEALKDLLISKNAQYGNSAIEPLRIASEATAEEQILVRIDDKLSRLARGHGNENEDVWQDLLGYILLLRVCRRVNGGIR
jgi:hypothetical protein